MAVQPQITNIVTEPTPNTTLLVTGAAGFIGSNFCQLALHKGYTIIALDALTYAGHRENLKECTKNPKFHFIHDTILNPNLVSVCREFSIDGILNFAAESHVDRSIHAPKAFIETNIEGVFNLLSLSLTYFNTLSIDKKKKFRFLQVSTDEVYGSLDPSSPPFTELSRYNPRSPYSSSKACGDHLTQAWHETYHLPTLITHSSNNYGPRQHPEKLIPHMILCALTHKPLPVYGNGMNIRDWIHVYDHAQGIIDVYEKGRPGETYCLGSNNECTNLEIVKKICSFLDTLKPPSRFSSYHDNIQFVDDRPGHDFRYSINPEKAKRDLGFVCTQNFDTALKETILWYLNNTDWIESVLQKNIFGGTIKP